MDLMKQIVDPDQFDQLDKKAFDLLEWRELGMGAR
jgi:hypothetical protein